MKGRLPVRYTQKLAAKAPKVPPPTTTTLSEAINGTMGFFGSRRWPEQCALDEKKALLSNKR